MRFGHRLRSTSINVIACVFFYFPGFANFSSELCLTLYSPAEFIKPELMSNFKFSGKSNPHAKSVPVKY